MEDTPVTLKEQLTVMFSNLLNHWTETTSFFMNYSAINFIQLTLKILTSSMSTFSLSIVNINFTKHLLKYLDKFQNKTIPKISQLMRRIKRRDKTL